jgi:hypothetical protein
MRVASPSRGFLRGMRSALALLLAIPMHGQQQLEDRLSLNIALHAQVSYATHGKVVGSEITCAGLRHAFESEGHDVQMFYPFEYTNLTRASWDLVVIEGWFEMIHAFIHEIRRASGGRATVFFFCLDPDFPGMEYVRNLDVDGFLTNSAKVVQVLGQVFPTELVQLAANTDVMRPGTRVEKYQHNVTFVGTAGGVHVKRNLAWMLREAAPFGLAIYGTAWDDYPEFAPYWRGVLPKDDIPALYTSAHTVLGTTMDAQLEYGMVNNRVFEALACEAVLISDFFPSLETQFGQHILYAKGAGDVTKHLESVLGRDRELMVSMGARGRSFVAEKHTWKQRAVQIQQFRLRIQAAVEERKAASGRQTASCERANCKRLGVALHPSLESSFLARAGLQYAVLPGLGGLKRHYNVSVIDASQMVDRHRQRQRQAQQQGVSSGVGREGGTEGLVNTNAALLREFDFIIAVGPWCAHGDDADVFIPDRPAGRWPLIALHLFGSASGGAAFHRSNSGSGGAGSVLDPDAIRIFDVLYYQTELERTRLHVLHPNMQHATGIAIRRLSVDVREHLLHAKRAADPHCQAKHGTVVVTHFRDAARLQQLLVTRAMMPDHFEALVDELADGYDYDYGDEGGGGSGGVGSSGGVGRQRPLPGVAVAIVSGHGDYTQHATPELTNLVTALQASAAVTDEEGEGGAVNSNTRALEMVVEPSPQELVQLVCGAESLVVLGDVAAAEAGWLIMTATACHVPIHLATTSAADAVAAAEGGDDAQYCSGGSGDECSSRQEGHGEQDDGKHKGAEEVQGVQEGQRQGQEQPASEALHRALLQHDPDPVLEAVVGAVSSVGVPSGSGLIHLNDWEPGWAAGYFTEQLWIGISRMLCYGRINASVAIVSRNSPFLSSTRPSRHQCTPPCTDVYVHFLFLFILLLFACSQLSPLDGAFVSGSARIAVSINDFAVRRDGASCLYINHVLKFCLHQPQLHFVLDLSNARQEPYEEITVTVGLKGNVYTDLLRRSEDVRLKVAPWPGDDEAQSALTASLSDSTAVVHQVVF